MGLSQDELQRLRSAHQITAEDELLTPAEVAALFRVNVKSVSRWAKEGRLSCVRTLGGHRRFFRAEVMALLGVKRG